MVFEPANGNICWAELVWRIDICLSFFTTWQITAQRGKGQADLREGGFA